MKLTTISNSDAISKPKLSEINVVKTHINKNMDTLCNSRG